MTNTEILREFLLETHENLSLLDSDLVKLESHPEDRATLAQVFRTLHSVKGTAGFMGLVKLQAVAHSAESLLGRLRAGEIRLNPTMATALLQVVDAIREILASIETSGGEGTGDYTELTAEVDRLRERGGAEPPVAPPVAKPVAPVVSQPSSPLPVVQASPPVASPPIGPLSAPPIAEFAAPVSASPTIVMSGLPPAPPSSGSGEPRSAAAADTAIRVDVGLLDKLMTLVGELVLARNQILQRCESQDDARTGQESNGLGDIVQRLNLLTTELQASVMKTRMQPIGNVLGKFPRIVRDLSLACQKKVRFEMEGEQTELDKTLIEAIRDPLTHMIRNAVDHGIEPPHVRASRGKPEEGRLRVVAFHEGGKVVIEITDDGGGIDAARVREKALAAKLISPEAAARMSPQELQRLIFLPGFSTAERVTQFSGRGVGMDVVRTNIEKIGGTVDLESTPGEGTTIRTKIPLTLAIIPALIVVSGGERFAIPQVSLLELVRLEAEQAGQRIERLHGVPVYRLRGALLPLVFLDVQLELATKRGASDDLNIIVLQADDRPFGLVVDAIRDTEEIVVKPLQQELKGIPVFAGATIMGDGRVALVLDVAGLAQRASVISGIHDRGIAEEKTPVQPAAAESQSLLLFEPTAGGQMAIPLSLVSRLEEFPRSRLEPLGTRHVVQYNEAILPLIDVSEELSALAGQAAMQTPQPPGSDDAIPVVVYSDNGERVGLIVRKILDVVHEPPAARSRAHRPGTLYTSVVQERVTEFVDVAALVREAKRNLESTAP
jgi:two-component system chemotaxis sensor kinase CheA